MPLQIFVETVDNTTKRIALEGHLDTLTANELDQSIQANITPNVLTLILDLQGLDFVSSAGLRIFAKARKLMKSRDGQLFFLNLTPQVKKVFDIVKAVPITEVFQNSQELDDYLTSIQAKVVKELQSP